MKKVLESGEKAPSCCYRRRSGDDFRWNLMEVVPDSDKDSPYIYVYVKDIHDIFRESLELDEASARVQEVIRTLGEQNFGVYGVDLDTGEANLVRENGHTHTGWKWGDMSKFDLCMDSQRLGLDACVDILTSLMKK